MKSDKYTPVTEKLQAKAKSLGITLPENCTIADAVSIFNDFNVRMKQQMSSNTFILIQTSNLRLVCQKRLTTNPIMYLEQMVTIVDSQQVSVNIWKQIATVVFPSPDSWPYDGEDNIIKDLIYNFDEIVRKEGSLEFLGKDYRVYVKAEEKEIFTFSVEARYSNTDSLGVKTIYWAEIKHIKPEFSKILSVIFYDLKVIPEGFMKWLDG